MVLFEYCTAIEDFHLPDRKKMIQTIHCINFNMNFRPTLYTAAGQVNINWMSE